MKISTYHRIANEFRIVDVDTWEEAVLLLKAMILLHPDTDGSFAAQIALDTYTGTGHQNFNSGHVEVTIEP